MERRRLRREKIFSEITTDNITNTITYYENGKIKSEIISKAIAGSNSEVDSETLNEIKNQYYSNGQLQSQSTYKDGILDGLKNIWDTGGNLVLIVTYKKGQIIE